MTEQTPSTSPARSSAASTSSLSTEAVQKRLKERYRKEKLFRLACVSAVIFALGFLLLLFGSIISKGWTAFLQTHTKVEIYFDPDVIDPDGTGDEQTIADANYATLVRNSLGQIFPDATGRSGRRALAGLVSSNADFRLRDMVLEDPSLIGQTRDLWFLASTDVDMLAKGHMDRTLPEDERRLSDQQIAWVDTLENEGRLETHFNTGFFTRADSREPEQAGIRGAIMGSFFTMLVTLLISFPLAVATAVYLEEFAPRNRWTDLIEVNINNLAAVPSIVFGLLGLAVFLNVMHLPRSAPLVGGLVLSLMTLPTIIIAARAALKAVPPSIRQAAYGLGASPMQVMFHHVLPLAMPGILTGTIIGMAQALGETAPLLMIGMVAFVVDVPGSIMEASTVLPVQVYLWADLPERGFVERTSAAIMVLLGFLILMNAFAVFVRRKTEQRW